MHPQQLEIIRQIINGFSGQFTSHDVREAMMQKGYRQVPSLSRIGVSIKCHKLARMVGYRSVMISSRMQRRYRIYTNEVEE